MTPSIWHVAAFCLGLALIGACWLAMYLRGERKRRAEANLASHICDDHISLARDAVESNTQHTIAAADATADKGVANVKSYDDLRKLVDRLRAERNGGR